jgi:hypothetical protein
MTLSKKNIILLNNTKIRFTSCTKKKDIVYMKSQVMLMVTNVKKCLVPVPVELLKLIPWYTGLSI